MKFIVTGGAGFIGHNVIRLLKQQGHDCFVFDSMTNYGFVPQHELDYLIKQRGARMNNPVHQIDIREIDRTDMFFKTFGSMADAVIHLASFPRQKIVGKDPVWGAEVMGTGLINLLELTRRYHIPKFVYISSSMVYGDFVDDVREDAVCNPQGQYGIMKLMGERLVEDYTRRGCFDHVILRPSAVYGEYDVEDRVVSKFMLSAMRGQVLRVNGAQETLDFTYVEDAAQGIVAAALNTQSHGIYNITKSHSTSLLQAAELAVQIAGRGHIECHDRDADFPSRGALNIDRARRELDFDPQVDVEQGFQKYHKWFLESDYWQSRINV